MHEFCLEDNCYAVSHLQLLLALIMPVVSIPWNVFKPELSCNILYVSPRVCCVRATITDIAYFVIVQVVRLFGQHSPPCIMASLSLWYQLRRQRLPSSVSSEGKPFL